MQTIFSEIKDEFVNLAYREYFDFEYDYQETFTFKDEGQTLIDFKVSKEKSEQPRDLLFVFSGQVGCNQSLYTKEIIREAYEDRGYDIAMISFRG